jgi:hypothetical protein
MYFYYTFVGVNDNTGIWLAGFEGLFGLGIPDPGMVG